MLSPAQHILLVWGSLQAPYPVFLGKEFQAGSKLTAMINSGGTLWVSCGPTHWLLHVQSSLSLWKSHDLTKLHWALTMINLLQLLGQGHQAWEQLSTLTLPWPSPVPNSEV